MRKIICDRCGKECTGTHGQLTLRRSQFAQASHIEPVAEDGFEPLDLCDICTEVARTEWGFRISQFGGKIELTLDRPLEWAEPVEQLAAEAIGAGGHYVPPEDEPVPATLAVGMVVNRAIATRWNQRACGEGSQVGAETG